MCPAPSRRTLACSARFAMFEYVWCGSSVLPVDLSACMRLKHNLVWCCEDRPWIVPKYQRGSTDAHSVHAESFIAHAKTLVPAAFSPALRGYLEKLQNSCQMRVREPREDWNQPLWLAYNTSSAENMDMMIWHDVTADRIVIYDSYELFHGLHGEMWLLASLTKLVTSAVRGPVYFQLPQEGLMIEI